MSKKDFKDLFKGVASVLLLTLLVSLLTLIPGFEEQGTILGVLSGAFLYEELEKLLGKVKGLKDD